MTMSFEPDVVETSVAQSIGLERAGPSHHELVWIHMSPDHAVDLFKLERIDHFRIDVDPIQFEPAADRVKNRVGQSAARGQANSMRTRQRTLAIIQFSLGDSIPLPLIEFA